MHYIILRASLISQAVRITLFGAQAGQRWLFRRDRGWLGGHRMTDRSVLWICFAFALLGFALLTNRESSALGLASAAHWPSIPARIVALQVDERHSAHGVDWVPHITYRYSVAGRHYQSSRVSFATLHWSSREQTDAFLARYIGRADVQAYYDPRRPDQAFLEEPAGTLDPTTFAGVLMVALAVGTLLVYVRLR